MRVTPVSGILGQSDVEVGMLMPVTVPLEVRVAVFVAFPDSEAEPEMLGYGGCVAEAEYGLDALDAVDESAEPPGSPLTGR